MTYFEDKVLDYLRHNDGITVKSCEKNLGTTELRKVISMLRDKGYKITDIWESGCNRFGISTRWKRYFLLEEREVVSE